MVFIAYLMQAMAFAIIARSLSTWFPAARNNPLVVILYQVTDPILIPLSRIIPRAGMFDFSPMVAVLVLFFLSSRLAGTA
ncbi:MAG: YggT family protein [Chloroflexi bacterium]|nr:YggT family protein [Chloroflexota bacterium]MBT4073678.1 YggT family protein [Chloroflexota bacterium]MBT6682524.1 YggT family protein [Chloroflexota bacterium]